MKWWQIRKLTEVSGKGNEHDSIRKHFQIVQKVKDYLARGVPQDVILELIEEAEDKSEVFQFK